MQKAQGALEYLLLIGGAVLVAVIVITLLLGLAEQGQTDTQATTDSALSLIEQRRLELINGTTGTTEYNVNFPCVTNYSGTSTYYQFSFPQAKNGQGITSTTNIDGLSCSFNPAPGVEEITSTANPVTVIGYLGAGCDLISFTSTFPLTIKLMDYPTGGNNFSNVKIYPGDGSPKTLTNEGSVTITESEISDFGVNWAPPVSLGNIDACIIYAKSVVTP